MQSVVSCPQCGGQMMADSAVSPVVLCPHCQARVTVTAAIGPDGLVAGGGSAYPSPYPAQMGAAAGLGHGKAVASLVLGICSLVCWFCPLVGLAVSIVGLVLGVQANKLQRRGMATAGVVLSIIGLVLTVINGGVGAYLGATGQNPLLKGLHP